MPGGETHQNCPRNALRASRRNARVAVTVVGHGEWVVDDVAGRGHHEVRTSFKAADKRTKGRILDEVVSVTGWSRTTPGVG